MPNISRGKGSQTMKFGQLLEYNTRNNFLEKSYMKYDGESIPRSFYISGSRVSSFMQFVFIVCQVVRGY